MKRFLAGLSAGSMVSAIILFAQHRASEKIVPPQAVVDNAKVRMVRWVLRPGEGTPVHTHVLDHISVVVHGSTLRDVAIDGTTKENLRKTGDAAYVPGKGLTHSFANAGKETFESISIELK
jgi:quercetin dioxygenase-like cupin family protein